MSLAALETTDKEDGPRDSRRVVGFPVCEVIGDTGLETLIRVGVSLVASQSQKDVCSFLVLGHSL